MTYRFPTGPARCRPSVLLAGAQGEAAPDGTADRKGGADAAPGRPGSADARKPAEAAGTARVIRTATLAVRVADVSAALDEARTRAEDAGGYVGDETTDRDATGHERSRLVLRVPQEEYQDVLDDLAGTGRLLERRVTAQDVTDEVVDVESRLASQQASVARVRELMDDATELSDVVALEGELSTRQAELESLKARQQSLKDRTSMSTITLVLSERGAPVRKDDGEPGFPEALAGGWGAFTTVVRWLAVAVGAALPFLAALVLLVLGWRVVRRRLPRPVPRRTAGPYGAVPPPPAAAPAARPEPAGVPEPPAAEETGRNREDGRGDG